MHIHIYIIEYNKNYSHNQPLNSTVIPDIHTIQPQKTINIIDWYGNIIKANHELNRNIFNESIRRDIVSRVVEWQRAKSRQGTHSTLTRAEVSGTGKKPHPQKGTGRARQGTLRAPHMRGGGVSHGPKPRDYEFKLNKKVRRFGMRIVLTSKYNDNNLYVMKDTILDNYKTQNFYKNILEHNQWNKQPLLFVYSQHEILDNNLILAIRNIEYVDIMEQVGLNVLSMLRHKILIITQTALHELENRLDESQRKQIHEFQGIDASNYHHSLIHLHGHDNDSDAVTTQQQTIINEESIETKQQSAAV